MQEALESLISLLRTNGSISEKELDAHLRALNKKNHDPQRRISKRRLLSFYMEQRRNPTDFYLSLDMSEDEHASLLRLLRAKPRRTASGVATVSVLTMPWPCKGDCLYCPNDVRMPKSYMHDEPACQRAERLHFDPYLQVAKRLFVLEDMGHSIDKVELIVLGGTFSDYPERYQRWFVKEMFRALNEARTSKAPGSVRNRESFYEESGLGDAAADEKTAKAQQEIDAQNKTYNESLADLFSDGLWKAVDALIDSDGNDLDELHAHNEVALSRNVGLVFETRPECVDEEHLKHLRSLGATKIQIGIQSLDDEVLLLCDRPGATSDAERAMEELRRAGFKSHVHYMVNLPGSAPEKDMDVWNKLIEDPRFMPDEAKVYPCALVESARMMRRYDSGDWAPYSDDELMQVLLHNIETCPPYMRISRMIRDICSQDIVAGNKHTNLRQMVEEEAARRQAKIKEMRYREIGTCDVSEDELTMSDFEYSTANTCEHFLQWATPEGGLAAFCRLSLPHDAEHAMVRELHVYGKSTDLGSQGESAQHKGLGRKLIEKACEIAKIESRQKLKVISAIGTRGYYRGLGFVDDGLYQTMELS